MSSQRTESQKYAANALARVSRAEARTLDQKHLDLMTAYMLQQIESGEQLVVAADEHKRLKDRVAELESRLSNAEGTD